ncbi:polysaccharide deacetylase family protein [Marinomonas aquiplantarum]|uniref:DUF7033 domain-containing protein n=1 Tax=Marinomonas aquiplantarum TaxID=491951 RepID=A0A366D8A9_9GAMM|nr:polysaccharide deacetylase family protein [Marinomonas aquiplantarum]RBO85739.1 hypothetical protein DFP76_10113 [Marinomonas aquiplantarum]
MLQFSTSELSWLCTILKERFGLCFMLDQSLSGLKLSLVGLPDSYILFPKLEEAFHQSRSDFPCSKWNATKAGWVSVLGDPLPAPCVSELPEPLIEQKTHHTVIHYDILGLTYWMLNRIEEIGRTDLDLHGRFPATSSHAYQHDYLERPVVDEWLHLLGQVIQKVWPSVSIKKHQFSIKLSHDVDRPSRYAFRTLKPLLRAMAGDVLKYSNFKGAIIAPWIRLKSRNHLHHNDPFNTFDWIMQQSEANNLTSAFYFICGGDHLNDADYQPEDSRIRQLLRQIHLRGHEIGLHPSYDTYQNPAAIQQEADCLLRVCKEEGIEQGGFGGRMHYLRWENPVTLQSWEDAGMTYDSTLSYADRPGFRCGTCYEYSAFNVVTQKSLLLRIRPLVVMECSIMGAGYMGLGSGEAALQKILEIKDVCRRVDGCFTLLWHNSELYNIALRDIYKRVIS